MKVSNSKLMNIIQNLGTKDMDIDLYEAINKIFMDYDQIYLNYYKNFRLIKHCVPYIIHKIF